MPHPLYLIAVLIALPTAAAPPSPKTVGQLIDIGGRKLHLVCQGKGSPAVVLESGAGEFSMDWALVMPSIARVTRVCAWDRAGYAWSDMSPGFERFSDGVADMRELLRKAGIDPPLILAGHAMGALYAREYQRRFPADVAGLVLVDPMPEEDVQAVEFGKTVSLIDMADHDLVAWPVRPFAPSRTSPPPRRPSADGRVEAPFDKLPRAVRPARQWALQRLFQELDGLSPEQAHDVMESERVTFFALYTARHVAPLPIPVTVLSRGKDSTPRIHQMQDELARLSRTAIHKTAEASGEQIQIEQPELVDSAVADMVKAIRVRAQSH